MTSSAAPSDLPLDYGGVAGCVEGLGPNRRAVIWVRGCRRRCAGCMADELAVPGAPSTVREATHALVPLVRNADGLTVSGGEPFDQAAAVSALVSELRREVPDLEVLVYTGYLVSELESGSSAQRELLTRIDIAVDGPFEQQSSDALQWRGSDNQTVRLLSARARERYPHAADVPWPKSRPIRIQTISDTKLRIIGIPRRGDIARVTKMLAEQGAQMRTGR